MYLLIRTGSFNRLIPDFIEAGVDGFLPMDVNAGMDIVKVRQLYPGLKFIGGFNKLTIEEERMMTGNSNGYLLSAAADTCRAATIRLRRILPLTITGIISNG